MKILVLEDDEDKAASVSSQITEVNSDIQVALCDNFRDYLIAITKDTFDLIIVDLVVPRAPREPEQLDMTNSIIEVTRDFGCINFRTPVVALTRFDAKAEENFKDLNSKDITVVTYSEDDESWKLALRNKISLCVPPVRFEFVVICALAKETDAFVEAKYDVGAPKIIGGLACRELQIDGWRGVIVTCPRMGLVSCSITSAQAIEAFKPRLICMSGICGGVIGKAKIYDVVIPEICHQHDSGKWTDRGFEPEIYSVQLEHSLRLKLEEVVAGSRFKEIVARDVVLARTEFPEGSENLSFDIFLAPTSSGSAVVAEESKVKAIAGQHRKLSAFEMESYAVYEAARLSVDRPLYFSAKSVVDDGGPQKGDRFHRVACLLSAKVVYECLRSVLAK